MYVHAFTHDLSKFRPSEFIPYARYFYIDKEKYKHDFDYAWSLHYYRNKHHWNRWYFEESDIMKEHVYEMPSKYIDQMIADWSAMSRKFGDTPQKYYLNNYHKIKLDRGSRYSLERKLGLLDNYNAPFCECNYEVYMTLYEVLEDAQEYYNRNGEIRLGSVKANFNDLFKWICETYNVDLYEKLIK
ncbi:MAG: DUF5662 family protein [Cellulosilyticaceae bacterium]